eukprot:CAMPEP_0183293714 /NCGR_PEP_ID=MMETSP0160_2-20130417/2297_1 /TAXON_ID=2839 ORGANISM="Odontella Sinensis, Strain Grunow 1884" /NCGR_SAMPLE_ID=MMETSP0160_2 /ASSEMBLY_ACC=CAM_ASM_000250 /LENGTH=258 /DNA_ID=CAMNT_0025454875 /DNA_START=35 /DNA_END=811 /DNA_ORIENTATION=-
MKPTVILAAVLIAPVATAYAYSSTNARAVAADAKSATDVPAPLAHTGRRAFLGAIPASAASALLLPSTPAAAADFVTTVKVTPLAHTFITSGGKVKPLRENDATRFLTNARVVHVFYGDPSESTAAEVLSLTVKRKAGEGPGVTPGSVNVLGGGSLKAVDGAKSVASSSSSNNDAKSIAAAVSSLPAGDVLFVPPAKSGGTAADGAILAETAAAAGLEVGGSKGGGVIGILLNGPRDPNQLKVTEGSYEAPTILWYDV